MCHADGSGEWEHREEPDERGRPFPEQAVQAMRNLARTGGHAMTLRTISALLILHSICAWGASPWVPSAGKASVTLTYVDESFNSYWNGTIKRSFPQPPSPAKVFDQKTGYATLEYGLSN